MVDASAARLEALFTIVDFDLRDTLTDILNQSNMPFYLLMHGQGSAKSAIYDILGYGGPKKIVSISMQTKNMSSHIMKQLHSEMAFNKPGTGIAFTVSLSSISSVLSETLKHADENLKIGSEDMTPAANESYHLIAAIVNNGFFDQVMEVAKAAGATGGTLVHARGLGSEDGVKYLGITIQPEKDLVLILTTKEKRRDIMESITREVGLNKDGKGLCFSLPVNEAFGMGATLDIDAF